MLSVYIGLQMFMMFDYSTFGKYGCHHASFLRVVDIKV